MGLEQDTVFIPAGFQLSSLACWWVLFHLWGVKKEVLVESPFSLLLVSVRL